MHVLYKNRVKSSWYRNKHRVLGAYLSFFVETRFQLQSKFLDIFWSIPILHKIEGEEVGVLSVLKIKGKKS